MTPVRCKSSAKTVDDALARFLIQGIQHLVDEHPRREHAAPHARRRALCCSSSLNSRSQRGDISSIGTRRSSLSRRSAFAYGGALEGRGRRWVGQDLAQSARRQIGGARHIEHLFASRMGDLPGAPRPQPRQRAEQQCLAGSGLADDQNPLAGVDLDFLLLEHGCAGRRGDLQIVDADLARIAGDEGDAVSRRRAARRYR